MALNKKSKMFVVYVVAIKSPSTKIIIFLSKKTQITNNNHIQVIALKYDKAHTKFLSKH